MFTKWVLLTKKADMMPDCVAGIYMASLDAPTNITDLSSEA